MTPRAPLATVLLDAVEAMRAAPEAGAVTRALAEGLAAAGGDRVRVLLRHGVDDRLEVSATEDGAEACVSPILAQPGLCPVIRDGRPHGVADVRAGATCDCPLGVPALGGYACLPLATDGRIRGVANVQILEPGAPAGARRPLEGLAHVAALALAAAGEAHAAAPHEERDPETGAYTRQTFESGCVRRFEEASRKLHPLAMIRMQVSRDPAAREGADGLLRAFTRMAAGYLRPGDLFARLDQAEFVALLPDTSRDRASAVGARIREALRGLAGSPDAPAADVAVGIGVFPDDGLTANRVFDAAARALAPAARAA